MFQSLLGHYIIAGHYTLAYNQYYTVAQYIIEITWFIGKYTPPKNVWGITIESHSFYSIICA